MASRGPTRARPAIDAIVCGIASVALLAALRGAGGPAGGAHPDPATGVVLSLGWGHLAGALWRAPAAAERPRAVRLRRLRAGVSVLLAFLGYWSLLATPWLRAPGPVAVAWSLALGVSLWHILENELALAAARRRGDRALPSQLRAPWGCAIAAATVAAAAGWAIAGASTSAGHRDAVRGVLELYLAATLFHLASWLHWSLRRSGVAVPVRRRRARQLVAAHVPGVVLGGLLFHAPAAGGALSSFLFSPLVFGFASGLHVVHTALSRCRRDVR